MWVKQWLHNKWGLREKVVLCVVGVVTGDWSLNPAKPAAPGRRLEAAPGHEAMASMPSSSDSCANGKGWEKRPSPIPT